MSSNGAKTDGRLDGAEAALASAAAAMASVEQQIDGLWRRAVGDEDAWLSDRLVEVSHALRRAARLLERDPGIG
jgi:hypothetical protein